MIAPLAGSHWVCCCFEAKPAQSVHVFLTLANKYSRARVRGDQIRQSIKNWTYIFKLSTRRARRSFPIHLVPITILSLRILASGQSPDPGPAPVRSSLSKVLGFKADDLKQQFTFFILIIVCGDDL